VLRLWAASPPLTAASLLMLGALAVFLAGLALDPRVITGSPAWLKPAKFAGSTAIYMLTLAWIVSHLRAWPRLRRVVGWTTAVILVAEVGGIALQAWRGTTSHFNVATPFDVTVFALMGFGILVQTIASIAVAVVLWRTTLSDRALTWALRLGLTITILGASTGGLMTQPTGAQLAEAERTGRIQVAGAHTVGAPDGGRGLPGTGWSLEHGDLRVPHFVGLHAMQVLPALSLWFAWLGVGERRRAGLVLMAGASYATLFLILLTQALRGQSVVTPDVVTMMMLGVWAAVTGAAAVWPFRPQRRTDDIESTMNWINP
jgi:hypothetical protein